MEFYLYYITFVAGLTIGFLLAKSLYKKEERYQRHKDYLIDKLMKENEDLYSQLETKE